MWLTLRRLSRRPSFRTPSHAIGFARPPLSSLLSNPVDLVDQSRCFGPVELHSRAKDQVTEDAIGRQGLRLYWEDDHTGRDAPFCSFQFLTASSNSSLTTARGSLFLRMTRSSNGI